LVRSVPRRPTSSTSPKETDKWQLLISTPHPVPIRSWTTDELADDATYALNLADDGDASGIYLCWDASDPSDAAFFSVTASGTTVSAIDIGPAWGSHTWDDADTDAKLCLYVDSSVATLKNRSGSAATLVIARIL